MASKTLGEQFDKDGKKICGSRLNHPGSFGDYRCHRSPLKNKNRCKRHGPLEGVTGVAHPQYRGAGAERIKEKLPPRMQGDFDASVEEVGRDLSSTHLIGLMDARLLDLLGRVDAGVTVELWRELRRTWSQYQRALKQQGFATQEEAIAGAKIALDKLEGLIKRGADDAETWDEVERTVDRAHKLREGEGRRQRDAKDMVKLEKLEFMNRKIIQIIAEEVADPQVLRRIASRMAAERP